MKYINACDKGKCVRELAVVVGRASVIGAFVDFVHQQRSLCDKCNKSELGLTNYC